MTKPEHLEHLAGLQRLILPVKEDFAVGVVARYFADRGVECARDEARSIVRDRTAS